MGWFTDLLGTFSRSFTLGRGSAGAGVLDSAGNSAARTYTLQDASGVVPLFGPVVTATDTGTQNNYNPTGFATASVLRLNPASALTINGFAAPAFAKELIVVNVSAQAVTLNDENASSTAANRFAFGGVNAALAQHQPLSLVYDTTSSRWRAAAQATVTIDGLAADAAPDPAVDYLLEWDASAGQSKKVFISDVLRQHDITLARAIALQMRLMR